MYLKVLLTLFSDFVHFSWTLWFSGHSSPLSVLFEVMDKAQNGVEHPSPGVDRIFYTTLSNLPDVTPPRSLMWSHTRMPPGPVWLRASEGLLPRANGRGSTMERSGMGCSSLICRALAGAAWPPGKVGNLKS